MDLRSVWISRVLVFFMSLAGAEAQAKTLGDYQTEAAYAKGVADAAQARGADAAVKRADAKKIERDQVLAKKKDLVSKAKNSLSGSGAAKIQNLNHELLGIKKQAFEVDRVSLKYVNQQKAYGEAYAELMADFAHYQGSEAQQKGSYQLQLRRVQEATNATELVAPLQMLRDLRNREIADQSRLAAHSATVLGKMKNTYAAYEREIAPWSVFLTKYQIPKIDPPRSVYNRLIQIQGYVENRGHFFSEQTSQKIAQIESQMAHFVIGKVNSEMNEKEKEAIHSALTSGFSQTVNALLAQGTEIKTIRLNQGLSGGRMKLKPESDFYQEVLTYQEQCRDLEILKRESSPYYNGCKVLQSFFIEAEGFFDTTGWVAIKTTLRSAKRGVPPSIAYLVQKLESMKISLATKEPKARKPHLLEAIVIHDDLLSQWESAVSELASAEEGRSL